MQLIEGEDHISETDSRVNRQPFRDGLTAFGVMICYHENDAG